MAGFAGGELRLGAPPSQTQSETGSLSQTPKSRAPTPLLPDLAGNPAPAREGTPFPDWAGPGTPIRQDFQTATNLTRKPQ
jgi:hypothetical protein